MEAKICPQSPPAEGLRSGCPMAAMLEMLTRPWTLHILWLLSTRGPTRFGVLRRSVEGISARLLTVRLRSLEDEGFVRRTAQVNGNTHEVTYAPTSRTADMHEVMQHLHQLSQKWRDGHDGERQAVTPSLDEQHVAGGAAPREEALP